MQWHKTHFQEKKFNIIIIYLLSYFVFLSLIYKTNEELLKIHLSDIDF